MVSFASLSAVALMIASGSLAAPWHSHQRHSTHRSRAVGPTGVKVNSYHPPSTFEAYGVGGLDHTPVERSTPEEVAKSFLQNKLGVAADGLTRHAGHTSDGVSYEYFTQVINGIPVANAVANVALRGDKVLSYGSSFVKPNSVASQQPTLSLDRGIAFAEEHLDGKYNNWPAKLEYVAKDNGDVVLAHVVQIQSSATGMWKQVYVDAHSGEITNMVDFVADHSYRVVPLEYQDPTQKYTLVEEPQDRTVSPNGWHWDDKPEKGTTAGNNVVSYKGADPNPLNLGTMTSKESTPENNYDYAYNPESEPAISPNVDAARVNTFYVVNAMHDLAYKYGFTEAAFNFQDHNFGKGGKEADRVQVSVQDVSGTNNANFATPPDGQNGQMRMFVWTLTTPQRDGALENDIVVHEYTHGISNRLTGGGTGACLQTTEAGGMGEGWSDAMADITEAKTSPIPDFTLGSYVTNNPKGIRSFPYSTNMETNPLTYGDLAAKNEVHDIGEVWALMFHELLVASVESCGISDKFDAKEESGKSVVLHLFMDGLSIQPCNPTFVSARDAIIQADANRYGGKYNCTIWKAFAKRGLGKGAVAGTYANHHDVPEGC